MYKGDIISESLKDPGLLNSLKKHDVIIEMQPDYPAEPIWHTFRVEVENEAIVSLSNKLAEELKEGWYAHFWNGSQIVAVFPAKVFAVPKDKESTEYKEMVQYAVEHGVEEQFLGFGASW